MVSVNNSSNKTEAPSLFVAQIASYSRFANSISHCIVGWSVVEARTNDALQDVVDQAPQAQTYFSDGCATYNELVSGDATYSALLDKSETYSVEGGNADLRHYLARLARKSRCFSRCINALRRAIRLLVWAYNRRLLWNRRYPKYPKHVIDFASPPR